MTDATETAADQGSSADADTQPGSAESNAQRHTPRQWFVRDLRASTMAAMGWVSPSIDTILIVNKTGSEIVESAGDNCVIARIQFDNRTEPLGDSNMADARLIAAAPDGLAFALAYLAEAEASGGWKGDEELFAMAQAYVAKATGQAVSQ